MRLLRFLMAHFLTLLMLVGLSLLVVYLVRTQRAPGSMTVIESQAMDMSAMKAPEGAMPVALETVKASAFAPSATYTGTVMAYSDEDVVARVTGRVVRMDVYPGDHVAAGQVLVELDSDELSSRLAEARAGAQESQQKHQAQQVAIARSQQDLKAANRDLEVARIERQEAQAEVEAAAANVTYWAAENQRAQALYAEGGISQEERQKIQAEATQARVELHHRGVGVEKAGARIRQASARAQALALQVQQSALEAQASGSAQLRALAEQRTAAIQQDYTLIRAASQGDVTERLVSPGTLVSAGTVLMRLKQVDRVRVQARVPAEQAALVRTGARVEIRIPGRARPLAAHITSTFRAADPASRTVTVEALLKNPSDGPRLLPGSFADMTLALAAPGTSVTVALEALQRDLEGQTFVWLAQSGPQGKTIYTCVMHPEVLSDHPGKCPKCGMELVPKGRSGDLRAHRLMVKAGSVSGTRVAIVVGLKPGQQVVVAGYQDLQEGMGLAAVPWGPRGPVDLPQVSGSPAMPDMPGMPATPAQPAPDMPGMDMGSPR